VIGRLAAVGLALATAAGGVAVAFRDPWPVPASATASSPGATRLARQALASAVTCSGPETSIAPQGSPPSDPAGVVTLTATADGAGAARAVLGPLGPGATPPAPFAGGGIRVVQRTADVREPLRLAAGTDAEQTRLAAVQTTLSRAGDRRGLAAVACPTATTDAWLVGGATSTGRRARLLLLDPAPAAAVVDVVILGPRGPVDLPSARGVVVPPGRARALQLDALAPGLDRLAVHVVARRGRVAAVLDDSRLDGATPAGVDDVPVAAPPARHLTLPGVVVPVAPPGGTASAVVRLAVPGAEDAVVHLNLAGPQGSTPLRGSGVVTVPAGSVVDVPLTGLAAGTYAVLADADVPVVAGAVVRVAGPPAGPLRRSAADVGWTAPALPLTGDGLVALPRPVGYGTHGLGAAVGTTRLTLTAGDAPADVTVRQVGPHGERLVRSVVHVPAHRTTALTAHPSAAAVALRTDAGSPVWAGVATITADPAGPMLTLLPVPPPSPVPDHSALAVVADPWLPAQSSQSSSLP
jgi:hypothetical protein